MILSIDKQKFGLLLLLTVVYLESLPFSFETPIGRIRPNLVMVAVITIGMILDIMIRRTPIRVPKPVVFLAAYVAVNIFCLFKSESPAMSIRVVCLLTGFLAVCIYMANCFSTEQSSLKIVRFFFFLGVVQALIGLLEITGATFERPAATMGSGDSDYFALVMMGNLLVFNSLQMLGVRVFGRILDLLISGLFAVNVYYSFVRSSWIGYMLGLCFMVGLVFLGNLGRSTGSRKRGVIVVGITCVFFFGAYLAIPQIQSAVLDRVSFSETGTASIQENIRIEMMRESWGNALSSPIFGNGPGAFTSQGHSLEIDYGRGVAFDPSIATTIMNDTGLLGTIAFLIFLWEYYRYIFRAIKLKPNSIMAKYAVSFSVAVFGLLAGYLMTNGLWLPFSWVFFGFPLGFSVVSLKQKQPG